MATRKSRTARRKQNKTMKKPLWKKVLMTLLIIFLAMGITGVGVFAFFIGTAPKLDVEKLDVPYASQFYDKDGEPFADIAFGAENRVKIGYDDLPQVLIDAVVATEDARFFEHPGIDLRRIGGAIQANIKHGFGSEGASTITQQVVENMFLTPEKSIKLKVQEQWIALKLEREFSKEQILEMYLNKIFYGSNAYGVAKAAEVYFGIEDLNDLTLVQAAMLAGLPQRPTAYNPFENPDLMQERVDTVLKLMVRHGKITEEEANEARQVDVASVLTDKKPDPFAYDAFIQQAQKELEEKLEGVDLNSAGLKVYTTLDTDIQEHVEFLLTDSAENPVSYPDDDLLAGMTVVDTKTGEIRAVGGSRNRESAFGSNYAINPFRQPGSTIKPILSYGPAIEYEKWSTYHQINDDAPYDYGGKNPFRNWNRQYQGWVSARYALAQSLNVPALKTLEEIGFDQAKEFAEGLGINFHEDRVLIGDAIGGTETTISPLQLAGAFSAFGNEGIYTEPHAITKVEFPDGSVVDLKPEAEAVMSDYTAYMVTDMLKSVLSSGTGTNANIPGMPVAGKTGTTNLEGKSGANNSWFAGYTTNYSIAIWTGYKENNRIIENTQIPHALFKNTMAEISKDIETADFVKPDSVVEVEVEKGSNPPALPSDHTPKENIVTELFVKGTEPTSVSEKFDKLDPVSNLSANYNEGKQAIEVSWDYENQEDTISFEVKYKVDDGEFKELTTTEDLAVEIAEIESDATYTIQVTAVDTENGTRSEPKSATVKLADEEEEDEEETISPVEGLQASYNEANSSINIQWQYSGDAQFEVDINGEKQTVQSRNIQINGVTPGNTYNITVTPIVNGNRGEPRSTSITVDAQNDDGEDNDENDNENNNDDAPDQGNDDDQETNSDDNEDSEE